MNRMFFAQNSGSNVVFPPRTYGRLYNSDAYSALNFAPSGWRTASGYDWAYVSSFLGGTPTAGSPAKEVGTTHWTPPNSDATNSSGLTLLGGGFRYSIDGQFYFLKDYGLYASPRDGDIFVTTASYDQTSLPTTQSPGYDSKTGLSVRMVKINNTDPILPYITDFDGNVYEVKKIGVLWFTVQNWKSTTYNDGTPIPNVTSNAAWTTLTTGAMCAYNNDENNV